MKVGTRVKWITSKGIHGAGMIVAWSNDVATEGHVFVAVDAPPGEEHRMIYCALTWLSPE